MSSTQSRHMDHYTYFSNDAWGSSSVGGEQLFQVSFGELWEFDETWHTWMKQLSSMAVKYTAMTAFDSRVFG